MSVNPRQPILKSGAYTDEPGMFTDINAILRQFMAKKLRPTRTSPPIANDIGELEIYVEKSTKKLWTKINGSLVYFQGV